MTSRQTELRRDVQFIISEVIAANLDTGEFTDMSQWAEIFGHSEKAMRTEIIRQMNLMKGRAAR